MATTAKKVYDGLTEHVSSDDERERIRRSLYRTDASALGSVVPAWRERWTDAEVEQYQTQGYLAMDGLLTPEDVEAGEGGAGRHRVPRAVWNAKVGDPGGAVLPRPGGTDERIDDPELADPQALDVLPGRRAPGRGWPPARACVPLLDQLIGAGHRG